MHLMYVFVFSELFNYSYNTLKTDFFPEDRFFLNESYDIWDLEFEVASILMCKEPDWSPSDKQNVLEF